MKNVHIAFPNRIDASTLSGGSWLTSLPLNNLKNKRLSKLARSSNCLTSSTKFIIALPSAKSIDVVALVAHNLSADANIRISANGTSSFAPPAFDSGWIPMWPDGFLPSEQLEWEDDNFWLGTLSEEAVAGYRTPFSYFLASTQSYQYWQVEIDDTANPDGYISIGRVFLGLAFVPTINMSYGVGLQVNDATTYETSLTGEEFYDSRQRYRIYQFSLDWLTESEAYQNVLDMQRLMGTSGEIFVNGDPDDLSNKPRRSFLGRLQNISPVVHDHYSSYSTKIEIKEIL